MPVEFIRSDRRRPAAEKERIVGEPLTMIEPLHGRTVTVQPSDEAEFRKRGYRLEGEDPASTAEDGEVTDSSASADEATKPASASGRTRRPRAAATKEAEEDEGADGDEDDAGE